MISLCFASLFPYTPFPAGSSGPRAAQPNDRPGGLASEQRKPNFRRATKNDQKNGQVERDHGHSSRGSAGAGHRGEGGGRRRDSGRQWARLPKFSPAGLQHPTPTPTHSTSRILGFKGRPVHLEIGKSPTCRFYVSAFCSAKIFWFIHALPDVTNSHVLGRATRILDGVN